MKGIKSAEQVQEPGVDGDRLADYDVMPVEVASALVDEWLQRSRQIARCRESALIKRAFAETASAESKEGLLNEARQIEEKVIPLRRELEIILVRLGEVFGANAELRKGPLFWNQLPLNLRRPLRKELVRCSSERGHAVDAPEIAPDGSVKV